MRGYTARQTSKYVLADAVVRTVFFVVLTLLCFFSALWMAQDVFPAWVLSKRAGMWICGSVVFTAVLYEIVICALPQRIRGFCRFLVPVVGAVVGIRYWKTHRMDLEDGACAIVTEYLVKFNRHLKTSVFIWKGKTEFLSLALGFVILVVLLGLLLLSLLSQRRCLLLLFPAAVFVAELVIGFIPQWKGMAFFFTALLLIQADGTDGRKIALRVHVDRQRRHTQTWYLCCLPAVCLAASAVLILSGGHVLSDLTEHRLMAASPKVQAFQKKTEQSLSDLWGSYVTPRQEMVNNRTPHYTGKEMLRITASARPAEDVLLRGFCGTDYENGSWYCDRQRFEKACQSAGYEEEEAARELLQAQYDLFSQSAERIMLRYTFGNEFLAMHVSENTRVDYTIEHTGVRSRYIFEPYAIDHKANPDDELLAGDTAVRKSGRQHIFTFHGWDHFTGSIDLSMQSETSDIFPWYDRFAVEAYLDTSDRIPSVEEYFGRMLGVENPDQIGLEAFYTLEEFMNWESAADRNWLILLYLQQASAQIQDVFTRNVNRMQIALALAAALKNYQSYSLNPGPLPEGEDPVSYFLMQSQKGYCVHFASAAVQLLRQMGVPARYVSGYVVRMREFRQNGDSFTASVKDSNAHAWAEIYLEQIGWVPVDVTPAAPAMTTDSGRDGQDTGAADDIQTEETDADTGLDETDTDTDTDKDDTNIEETQTDADREELTSGKKPLWQRYSLVLLVAAVLTAVLMILAVYRQILRLYLLLPVREMRAGKYRRAVRRMNRRIYRRLDVSRRLKGRSLTDAQYEHLLKTVYQQISVEDWTCFMQIVRAAAFAQDEITKKEAQFCWQIYAMVQKKWKRTACLYAGG